MSIEVIQLTKQYGQQIAVNNISFTIPKGEIVGFPRSKWCGKEYYNENANIFPKSNIWFTKS